MKYLTKDFDGKECIFDDFPIWSDIHYKYLPQNKYCKYRYLLPGTIERLLDKVFVPGSDPISIEDEKVKHLFKD